jgi:quercetin dioxygenase-like cupin family protein
VHTIQIFCKISAWLTIPLQVKTYITNSLFLSLQPCLQFRFSELNINNRSVIDITDTVKVNGFPCKDPKMVKASDFLFQGLRNQGSTNNMFGFLVTPANVEKFPGLNTLGISMNRVDFAPGGVNPPHIHPRATEIAFVVEGTILAGFITTNNTLFSQKLEKGDVFVFPRGLVHFQQNIGRSSAMTITAFNSQLPGAQVLPFSLFGSTPPVPEDVLAKAFQISEKAVKKISSKFAPN